MNPTPPGERTPLATGTSYKVTATAIGAGNKKVTLSNTFQTLKPEKTFSAKVTTLGTDDNISSEILAKQFGVGIPITIMFSRAVKNKAAVEHAHPAE